MKTERGATTAPVSPNKPCFKLELKRTKNKTKHNLLSSKYLIYQIKAWSFHFPHPSWAYPPPHITWTGIINSLRRRGGSVIVRIATSFWIFLILWFSVLSYVPIDYLLLNNIGPYAVQSTCPLLLLMIKEMIISHRKLILDEPIPS